MFTGIIETVGKVLEIDRSQEHARLTIGADPGLLNEAQLGDSVAVNGVCLTVVAQTAESVSFDAVYETMRRTSLGHLAAGDPVNLERPLAANGRFGGHIVQGHVDATGTIASIRQRDTSYIVYVDVPRDMMKYIVPKGSITLDGISLTVVDAEDRTLSVSIIPHTWANTNLSHKCAGDPVNIETDLIGKYVERMMAGYAPAGQGASGGLGEFHDSFDDDYRINNSPAMRSLKAELS